jgi:hypothetical protein
LLESVSEQVRNLSNAGGMIMMKSKKRTFSGSDRRQAPRLNPSAVPFLKSVTFNQGTEAQVIDISRGGMLLETDVRLRPFMKILLKIVTSSSIFKTTGCVLRSTIVSINGNPRYQSAIAFEDSFQMMDKLKLSQEMQSSNIMQKSAEPEPFQESAHPTSHPKANPNIESTAGHSDGYNE